MKAYRSSADSFCLGGICVPVAVRQLPEADVVGVGGPTEAVYFLGLVDTGAARSMIRTDCAKGMRLPRRGKARLVTFEGEVTTDTYPAIVRVQDEWETELSLAGGDFDHDPGLDFLIGRDILQHASLIWAGPAAQFSLTFTRHDELSP